MRPLYSLTIALAALGMVAGCGANPSRDPGRTPTAGPDSADATSSLAAYRRALRDARYPLSAEVVSSLLSLRPDTPGLRWQGHTDDTSASQAHNPAGARVLVTTWTRAKYYTDASYQPGYEFPLYGETWFTAGTQVKDVCRASAATGDPGDPGALVLRIEQLLGLPPGAGYDAFLQVWIDPTALVRPCADPSVTTTTCPIASPMQATDDGHVLWQCPGTGQALASPEHQQWLCNTWINRHGPSDPWRQYPFTALGYTYDWNPDSEPVGPSEFVAAKGTRVIFESITATAAFCQ